MLVPLATSVIRQHTATSEHQRDLCVATLLGCSGLGCIAVAPLVSVICKGTGTALPALKWSTLITISSTVALSLVRTFPMMVIARIWQGISTGIILIAGQSLLVSVKPLSEAGYNLGLVLASQSLGSILGPALTGLIYQHTRRIAAFVPAIMLSIVVAPI